jgi:sulfate adenylyltransferase
MISDRGRRVSILDGDIVRREFAPNLGFAKADRDTNVRYVGLQASQLVRLGHAVMCALISPYRHVRDECRALIGDEFVEVFVSTPLEVCERRDPKGLYARARKGELRDFTGIDIPYEAPPSPEIVLDTTTHNVVENAGRILRHLLQRRLL